MSSISETEKHCHEMIAVNKRAYMEAIQPYLAILARAAAAKPPEPIIIDRAIYEQVSGQIAAITKKYDEQN